LTAGGVDLSALLAEVGGALDPAGVTGVAVSGGSDSVALLHLAHHAAQAAGRTVAAVTVDHGLRAESAAEAQGVARLCAGLGISHFTLHWQGWDGRGNLQAAAREARYALMAEWARGQGIGRVLLGHTQDDQAETFVMRLARQAGLDGLSGMAARFEREGVSGGITWARPVLGASRAALRAYLTARGVGWIDDPSNDNARFARVKARRALAALEPLGIDAGGLARVMAQLADARDALRAQLHDIALQSVQQDRGDLILDWAAWAQHHPELRRRILVAGLIWVASSPYAPRREDIAALLQALERPGQRSLAGCLIRRTGTTVRITREAQALRGVTGPTDQPWDRRWRLDGPHDPALHIAALGEAGLRFCPDWRAAELPRATLIAAPAVWDGTRLEAAPLAGINLDWTARIVADFHAGLVSH
jgi:tRNA(Ile)-lysidine synthase